uniref:Uncharacterized protein n=1 Tax=Coptotermes formosanus TaxID=36987 RepID=R4UNF8_COPFO|nr:hypothetical protein [Coptotermes formosanus]
MQCGYIVVLCLLAFSVQTGNGLRCWSCTSSREHHCGDPFNSTFFRIEDCDYNFSPNTYNQPSTTVCKKQKQIVNGQEQVIRSCEYKKETACIQSHAHTPVKVVSCETCSNDDGCNTAHIVTPTTLTALLPAVLWAVASKIL